MSRTNRYIESSKPYELCLRVKEGLPFPCLLFIRLLLESAMARAMRGRRVIVCHYLWMANHLHIVIVIKDATSAVKFYGELQKRLTDYMKQILGVKRLRMWEGRATVALIIGVDTAIWRISYLYANPAKANLIDRIEDYPGASSWQAFSRTTKLDDSVSSYVPWIRLPAVPKVGARSITKREDRELKAALEKSTKKKEHFLIEPNAWMLYLGVDSHEVSEINAAILAAVREAEQKARQARERKGKKPVGAARLREQAIMKSHEPKKKDRKVFVLCLDAEPRILFIEHVKALCEQCRKLFKDRLFLLWPPGMFRPPAGMLATAIEAL